MNIPELALGVGVASGGLEPALQYGGGSRPLGPVAVGAIRGLDELTQSAPTEESFDYSGILRADDRDKLLPFTRFHGQVL